MDTQTVIPRQSRPSLELDLIADFACPWSYLGKRSLERALANFYGLTPALRWHGFRPQSERGGTQLPWPEHVAIRLPPGVSVDSAQRNLVESGREVGIAFDFSKLSASPDTREAHRMVRLAAREGKQNDLVDALFSAFFEQSRDIADKRVLTAIGSHVGLGPQTLAAFDDPAQGLDEITAEEERLSSMGVLATPNLLINGRVLVPGPANVATYVQALDQALFPSLADATSKRLLH